MPYPSRPLQIIYPQLTQSSDGLMEIVRQLEGNQKAYIFWFIVNEKEDLKNIALKLNLFFDKNYCGIFIIKAVLNEDNHLKKLTDKIGIYDIAHFDCVGTPEQLQEYLKGGNCARI